MPQKGQSPSAKTKPSRAEDSLPSATQAPLLPGRPLLAPQPRSEAVWALAAANNRAAHHGVQGRNEGRGAAALGGVRLRLAWDGGAYGGWLLVVSVGTTAGGSRRAGCLSLSSESTMGLAERTARGACREKRPQ